MTVADKLAVMDTEMMGKHGWYAHCVPSNDFTPYGFNYHTHGLERSFGHTNIQVVIPIKFEIAHAIVTDIVTEIKNGKKFEPNVDYADIVANGYMVRFIEARECGRPVLRLLVPDPNGKYEGYYAKQLTMLDNQEGVEENERVIQKD